jgi:FAD/FMN-containing dehydrogenase
LLYILSPWKQFTAGLSPAAAFISSPRKSSIGFSLSLNASSFLTLSVILKPQTQQELLATLARCSRDGVSIEGVDLRAMAALVEHHPEDMTASVEAGMTLAGFQTRLRALGQWLPIDPPFAETLTIGDILARDISGPRRLGFGTIRDYLIGVKVALADGTLIKAGGKVVKNVAGYDLCKLFIGARHSLGIIAEATFKLRPLPEAERFAQVELRSLDELELLRTRLLASTVEPVMFEAWPGESSFSVLVAFAGNREDVEAQIQFARTLGMAETTPLHTMELFWRGGSSQKISVLPSHAVSILKVIGTSDWHAHLGNGVIFHRGGREDSVPPVSPGLMDRIKKAYDPKHILPAYA